MPAHLGSSPTEVEQPLKLRERRGILLQLAVLLDQVRQIVQIEPALHVLDRALQGADRLRLRGRPAL